MIELGELDKHHAEFDQRNTRVVVASVEGPEDAGKTQAEFPHLVVLADPERKLVAAAGVLHQGASTGGRIVAAPTTVLIDREGTVRWLHRSDRHIVRPTINELLAAIDAQARR